MQILINKNLILPNHIDIGCGNGTDIHILNKIYGIEAYGYDKYNPIFKNEELLKKKYDSLSCIYVFNVIPDLDGCNRLLEIIKQLSENIYICVRSDTRSLKSDWIYSKDEQGYWTSRGSFQRFYDEEMIKEIFGKVEYISNNKSFKLFKIIN